MGSSIDPSSLHLSGGLPSPTATLSPERSRDRTEGANNSHADRNLFRDPQLGVYPLHLCIVGHTFARAKDRILEVSERETRSSAEETITVELKGTHHFFQGLSPGFGQQKDRP
jgi:hypothetical protein